MIPLESSQGLLFWCRCLLSPVCGHITHSSPGPLPLPVPISCAYILCQVPFPRLTGPAPPGEYEEGYTCDANLARVYQLLYGFSLGNPVLVARAAMMVSPLACSVELLCFSVPPWLLNLLWNFVSSVVVRITVPQCHFSYGVFFFVVLYTTNPPPLILWAPQRIAPHDRFPPSVACLGLAFFVPSCVECFCLVLSVWCVVFAYP